MVKNKNSPLWFPVQIVCGTVKC